MGVVYRGRANSLDMNVQSWIYSDMWRVIKCRLRPRSLVYKGGFLVGASENHDWNRACTYIFEWACFLTVYSVIPSAMFQYIYRPKETKTKMTCSSNGSVSSRHLTQPSISRLRCAVAMCT